MGVASGPIQTAELAARSERLGSHTLALRGVVLLAGGVRLSSLIAGLGKSSLDLPLKVDSTLLCAWRDAVCDLSNRLGGIPLTLRALVSKPLELPMQVEGSSHVRVAIDYDKQEFRGTGGLLRDIADEYAPNDYLLVSTASQVLLQPLADIHEMLARADAEICLLSEPDGTGTGMMLVRCGVLMDIRSKGYIDFKEQALPTLAKQYMTRVARSHVPAVMSVRTLEQYIRVLRYLHDPTDPTHRPHARPDPFAEEWSPTFSLVLPGAQVSGSARIHDSVVMKGARVGDGAVVVRSLVSEGATVPSGASVFDAVIPRNTRYGGRD